MTKDYHITPERAEEIWSEVESNQGFSADLVAFANAVLDEVLGEPVGYVNEHSLEMLKDRPKGNDALTLWRTGIWDSENVALYAPKELK